MSVKKATIKSYDSAAHTATVQVQGSLALWLADLKVAANIPAADVVAGRLCAVELFDEANPQDAVITAIYPGSPSGPPGGGASKIMDADADTKVDVEESADEDKVRMAVAGTERFLLQAASPHFGLTGDLELSGHIALADASINPNMVLNLEKTFGGAAATSNRGVSCQVDGAAVSGPFDVVTALRFQARQGATAGAAARAALGMAGWAGIDGTNGVALLAGAETGIETVAGAVGAVSMQAYALYARSNRASATPKCPTTWGLRMDDFSPWGAAGDTVFGLQIDEFDADANPARYPIWYGDTGDGLWYLDQLGRQHMKETSAPAAVANRAILYVDTGGAGGRQRLMCIFESGAAQVLATEP